MEYSLVMIKPKFIDNDIINLVRKYLLSSQLIIIREFKKKFTKEQIESAFYSETSNKDEYTNYLASDFIYIFLVYGENCYKYTREIKKKIRNLYNLTHLDMLNILHSSDDGVEFYLQYSICDELHDLKLDSRGYANLFILDEEVVSMKRYAKQALVKENINELTTLDYPVDHIGFITKFRLSSSKEVSIVNYIKRKELGVKESNLLKVVLFEICLFDDITIDELNDFGVRGVLMKDENISIKDAELIYDILEKKTNNWVVLGGGKHISIGQKSYEKFLNVLSTTL